VNYLLDVNILLAWGWSDHLDHSRTAQWMASAKETRTTRLHTSPISEIGFVRVSVQRSQGRVTVPQAAAILRGMLKSLGPTHRFLADDLSGTEWPDWCASAARTTDAHLLRLAQQHGLQLATLDAGIPEAYLLPPLSPSRQS
jgi:predicted nucleic acid-binding protein